MLLIEDDDDDALIVADLLGDSPLEARLVRGNTLAEGVQELAGDVDCVLLDLRLPDAAGLEAVTRVRSAAPWIAVIVLTGFDDEAAGEAAVDAGAQDYLVKGKVDGDLLARAIRYAVGRRHADEVQQQLRVAEVRADENARLERGLVPRPLVANPNVWIATHYVPGRHRALVGGDFYDIIETGDGSLHAIIGDVSGRGPDEAVTGASLRIAWRALTLSGVAGEPILPTLQRMIEHERRAPRTFATICALEIDLGQRLLRLRRAGHPTPVLIDGETVTSLPLDHGGPPIGMFESSEWPKSRFELPARWSMLLYTDGAIEGHHDVSGRLGEEGLRQLIADHVERDPGWREDPNGLLTDLLAEIEDLNHEALADDVAMVLIGVQHDGR